MIGADLIVKFGGDAAAFKRTLNEMKSSVSEFASKVTGLNMSLPSMRGGAVGAAGGIAAAGLAAITKSTADYLSEVKELGKLSKKSGLPIEQLDQLGKTAMLSGVGIDTLGLSLRNMQKNLGAEVTPKKYALALAELGLTVGQLRGMKPGDQFKAIAAALADVDEPAKRSALAMRLFGNSGADILPMLSEGGRAFLDMVNGMEHMSSASVKAAQDFNRSTKEMRKNLNELRETLAEKFGVPYLEGLNAMIGNVKGKEGVSGKYTGWQSMFMGPGSPLTSQEYVRNDLTKEDRKKLEDYKKEAEARGAKGLTKADEDRLRKDNIKKLKEEALMSGVVPSSASSAARQPGDEFIRKGWMIGGGYQSYQQGDTVQKQMLKQLEKIARNTEMEPGEEGTP